MRYSVIVCQDSSVFHDEVEADNQEEAERKARDLIADAWDIQSGLDEARAEGDETGFDAGFDGFAVDLMLDQRESSDALREARLEDAGDALCDLLADAYTVHIYDPQNDEMPDPKDCPFQQAIAAWKEVRNG